MGTQSKRYERLFSDPKHRQKQKKRKKNDKLVNLVVLAALLYGGSYLIPKKDKEEFAELLGELPGEFAAQAQANDEPQQTASLASVLDSFLPGLATPSAADRQANEAEPMVVRASAEPVRTGRDLRLSDFPRAHENWERIEFLSAEASAQALQQMDDFLRTPPANIRPVAQVRDRKAVIYDDGANLRFLVMVEVADPVGAGSDEVAPAAAPAVMVNMPSAMSQPRLENSVMDGPAPRLSQGRIARARIEDTGADVRSNRVKIAGIAFTDHAEAGTNLIDLRAKLPNNRSIYVRGRAPLTVIEDFLARANFTGMGIES